MIACDEAGNQSTLSYGELAAEVARVAAGLRALGVTKGDRVAAYLPNIPAAIIGLLATASIGAIWSSCSPDFGPASVIDRFAQITPKVLFAVERYRYGGREFDRSAAVAGIAAALPGLAAVIVVGGQGEDTAAQARSTLAFDSLPGDPGAALEFEAVAYGHPLWVLYSSGTTGLPKAIVHSHGGIVQEHLKALCLHQDLDAGDVFFWYTTTGWMMWNFLAGGLLAGVTIVAYDGSATYPDTGALWRMAAEAGVTYFGTGAPYLLACAKAGLAPGRDHDLVQAARGGLHRLAAAAGRVPLGLPGRGQRPAARLLLRWHRRVHRVRRPVPAAAGAGGRDRRVLPRGQGGGLRRGRPAGHRRGGGTGAHRADAVHAGRVLERPGR